MGADQSPWQVVEQCGIHPSPFNVEIYNIKLLAAIESQGRSPRQTKGLPCMPRHDMDSIDDLLAQWKRAGTAFDPLTEGVLGRLVRLGRYLTRLLSDSAAAYDLSGEEWEALSVLKRVRGEAEAPRGGWRRTSVSPLARPRRAWTVWSAKAWFAASHTPPTVAPFASS